MSDLRVTVGADISQYQAGMSQAATIATNTSNTITRELAEAQRQTVSLGGAAQSASMRMMQMRSGISAARDGVLAFTVGGQAAERSLLAMGHHINSLVNETGSFRGAMGALASSLWGPGGIILGLSVAAELFMNYERQQKKAEQTQTEYQKAVESANKTATEEVTKLDSIYNAATNLNLPMSQRLEAVKQLQHEYPAYFANMSQEAILAGKAASAYDNLTNSIINSAVIKAGQEKLGEAIKPLVDLIGQQAKLKAEVDKANAERQKLNPAGTTNFGSLDANGKPIPGLRYPVSTGALARTSQTFYDDTETGKLETYQQHLKSVNDEIKNSREAFQQLIQELGINSLIDPDKLKTKDVKTGFELLEQQIKEAEKALNDAATDGKPISYLKELATTLETLRNKLEAIKLLVRNSGLAGGGAPELTGSFLGQANGLGRKLSDTKGVGQNAGVDGGRPLSSDDIDKTTESLLKAQEAYHKMTISIGGAQSQEAKLKNEIKATDNVVRIFGGGLTRAFEEALSGTQSFVQAMGQFLLQLIEKLIAAAAAAAVLDVLLSATGFGGAASFGQIFGQLSGLSGLFGGTSKGGTGGLTPMATGGIVTQPMAALVGEAGKEAVIPLDKLDSVTGNRGGMSDGQIVGILRGPDIILQYNRAQKQKGRIT